MKNRLENSLLTLLAIDNKAEQEDSFQILWKSKISTLTPLIKLDFNLNNKNNIIVKSELIENFRSNNFKSIIKDEDCLKKYK